MSGVKVHIPISMSRHRWPWVPSTFTEDLQKTQSLVKGCTEVVKKWKETGEDVRGNMIYSRDNSSGI